MFIDTSAVVAILLAEPRWQSVFAKLQAAPRRLTGAHVRLETSIVLATRLNTAIETAESFFDTFLEENGVDVMAIEDDTAHLAVSAYQRFGKGSGHKAKLNFADCLSYACAKQHGLKLLHVGDDFAQTDLRVA